MYSHIIVDDDGRILGVGASPQATVLIGDQDANPSTHWYDWSVGAVADRGAMPVTVEDNAIIGVPCLCACTVSGPVSMDFQADVPGVALTFDAPGFYTVRMEPTHPRWLPATLTFEVAA